MHGTGRRWLVLGGALAALWSCGGGGGGGRAPVAFIVNKTSGSVDVCELTAEGIVDFTRCRLASNFQFVEPIQLAISGRVAFLSVQDGIERCALRGNQLTACELAISDADFPVGLTLFNHSLFVADYSAKAVARYNASNLRRTATKSIRTAPTDVVFYQSAGFIVSQDVAGSVVLSCSLGLDDCAPAYSPVDKALLAMTVYKRTAFFTDASGNSIVACDVDDGILSGCTVQGDATVFNYPYGITVRSDVAYIPNRAEASITVCHVSGKLLSGCSKIANQLFDGPTWVTFSQLSTEAQRRAEAGDAVAKGIAKKIQAAMVGAAPPGQGQARQLLRAVLEQQLRAEILIHRAAGRDATALQYRLGHLVGEHGDLALLDAPPVTIPKPPPLVSHNELNPEAIHQEPPPPPEAA